MSNKNFLHTIVAPSLTDSNFGQSIQTQFDNINTNFQRLVSAAYLSGQDGNDVVVKDVPIYTDVITFIDRTTNEVNVYNTIDVITEFLNADVVNYDFVIANKAEDKYAFLYSILQQAVFTDFGLQLVETIFSRQFELTYRRITSTVDGVEVVHSNLGYVLINEDLEQVFPSYSDTNKYPVWLSLVCSPLVRMFAIHDIDTDTTTNICATQLYYFYDARIGSIQLLDDKYTANDFTDYTSFITISSEKNADGDYEINGTYTMSKSQDLPTMYYDNDAQEFCWKMNGIETNITAQGVKGDKGDSAGCWFCRGVADTIQENNDPMITVRLTSYYTTDDTGNIILRSVTAEDCEIKNGDFVCVDVYNSDATNNTTYFDTIFGNVEVYASTTSDFSQLVYNVTRPYYTSVVSMMNNSPILLYKQLGNIRNDYENDEDTLHGLYIPIDNKNPNNYDGEPYLAHAMMSYTSSTDLFPPTSLTFTPVRKQNLYGKGSFSGFEMDILYKNERDQNGNLMCKHDLELFYNLLTRGTLTVNGDVKLNSDVYIKHKTEIDDELKTRTIIARGAISANGSINAGGSITAGGEAKSKVNGVNNVKLGVPIGTIMDFSGKEAPDGWLQINESEHSGIMQGSKEFEKYKGVTIGWVKPGQSLPSRGILALNDIDLSATNFVDSTNGLVFDLDSKYLNFIYTMISYDLPVDNISFQSTTSILKVKISTTDLENIKEQLEGFFIIRDSDLSDMAKALTWPFEIIIKINNDYSVNDIYMTLYKK